MALWNKPTGASFNILKSIGMQAARAWDDVPFCSHIPARVLYKATEMKVRQQLSA